jgi:hypothetical protein
MLMQKDPKRIARELSGFLQDAVGDRAYDVVKLPGLDPDLDKKIKQAKKRGVTDIAGWLADEQYNDPILLRDLLGDRLYDETRGNKELRNQVLDLMDQGAHAALKKAIKELRRD